MRVSRSQPSGETGPVARPATYLCDICESVVSAAHVRTQDGQILGLITCTACVEDALAARQLETAQ